MKREDTHRPSALDPAEYTLVGSFDAHYEYGYEEIDESFSHHEYSGHYSERGRGQCDHCGQSIRYGAIFHHEPSDKLVAVGLKCAHTLNLNSLSEKKIKAKAEHHRILKAIERWKQERPENAEAAAYFAARDEGYANFQNAMQEWNETGRVGQAPKPTYRHNEFVSAVARKLRRYGSLSEKQVEAVLKVRDRDAEFAARREAEAAALADAPILAEGRYEITGTVISTKEKDGYMPGTVTYKMLVKMADGNKVYGTIPQALPVGDLLKGREVTFTAKVERSKDDEHFGFFSRPTKATASEEAVA